MGTPFLLRNAFPEDKFEIMITQRLLEFRFPRRVDALPDNYRIIAYLNRRRIGCNYRTLLLLWQLLSSSGPQPVKPPDMPGRGSAAAAGNGNAHIKYLFHCLLKFIRADVVYGSSSFTSWKAGIWIYNNRNRSVFDKFRRQRFHLNRSKAAVHSHGVHAKSFQKSDSRLRRTAGQHLPLLIEYYSCKNRQAADLFGSQHSRFQLVSVTHCFNQDQVGTLFRSCFCHLPEY